MQLAVGVLVSCVLPFASATCQVEAQQKPSGKTRGVVVDELGQPLGGVAVSVVPSDDRWTSEELVAAAAVRTDASGRFELPAMRGGELQFVVRGRARLQQRVRYLAMWPVQLPKAGTLIGQVRGPDDKPVAGARVVAEDHMRGHPFVEDDSSGNTQAWLESATRTDERGRFILRGVYDTAVKLSVTALGYEPLTIRPVSKLDPLTLSLTKAAGIVRGTVVAPGGAPAAGVEVYVRQSNPTRTTRVVTDDEGCFRATWFGGSTRLSVTAKVDGESLYIRRTVETAGDHELQLAPRKPRVPRAANAKKSSVSKVQPEKSLRVEARMPDGTPCAKFRVAVFQIDSDQTRWRTDMRPLLGFDDAAVAGVDGVATAPVFEAQGSNQWLVLARAEGCAMIRHEVEVDTETADVQFAASAPVRGRVVDARTGKPVPRVRTWFLPQVQGKEQETRRLDGMVNDRVGTTTGEDGSFELADATLGKGRLLFAAPGYEYSWQPHEVKPDAAPVIKKLEPLVVLPGRVEATPLPERLVAVRVLDRLPGRSSSDFRDLDGAIPIARDGSFSLSGQSVGQRHLELVVQRAPRQGRPDKVVVATETFTHDTKKIVLDGDLARSVRVHGKVAGPVPVQRLAVLCSPIPKQGMHYGYLQYRGPMRPLAIDGSYDLTVLPRKCILAVLDVETGVLYRRRNIDVRKGDSHRFDLEIDGHQVRIRIEADAEVRKEGDFFLELMPQPEFWPSGIGQITTANTKLDRYCKGMGVRVPAGAEEVVLWLASTTYLAGLRRYSYHSAAQAEGDLRGESSIDATRQRAGTLRWSQAK